MLGRVEKTQAGLVIPVTAEMARSLELAEGAEVEILPATLDTAHYASVQETLAAFERTLPEHENSYRELAK